MLILSIVPLHLYRDSNSVMVDPTSQIDLLEHQLMALEALRSSKLLNQELGYVVTLVDNNDMDAITQTLQNKMNEILQYLQTQGSTDSSDAGARLLNISTMIQWVVIRISDLQALRDALLNNQQLNYVVSGVDNNNLLSVEAELVNQLAYQQMLLSSKQFWEQAYTLQGGNLQDLYNSGNNNTANSVTLEPTQTSNEAVIKRRLSYLMSLYNSLSGVRDVSELKGLIEQVIDEINYENSKLSSDISLPIEPYNIGNKARSNINDLKSDLIKLKAESSTSISYSSIKQFLLNELVNVGATA